MLDYEGKEVPGNRGYKYFGAAKDLPGVKELFEQDPPKPVRKTRAELMRDIDADYYGYRDEDDGIIVPLEREVEKKAIQKLVDEWKTKKLNEADDSKTAEEVDIYSSGAVGNDDSDEESAAEQAQTLTTADGPKQFISHVPVPSQQEIEEALVRRKKMELLQKYTSDALRAEAEEAKKLLGV